MIDYQLEEKISRLRAMGFSEEELDELRPKKEVPAVDQIEKEKELKKHVKEILTQDPEIERIKK